MKFLTKLFILTIIEICFASEQYFLDQNDVGQKTRIKLGDTTFENSSIVIMSSSNDTIKNGHYAISVAPPQKGTSYEIFATVITAGNSSSDQCDDFKIIRKTGIFNDTFFSGCSYDMPRSFKLKILTDRFIFELIINGTNKNEMKIPKFEIHLAAATSCYGMIRNDEFSCDSIYCINAALKCDNINNCPDFSDESTGVCQKSTIIALSLGGVIVAISIVAILVFLYKQRKRATLRNQAVIPP